MPADEDLKKSSAAFELSVFMPKSSKTSRSTRMSLRHEIAAGAGRVRLGKSAAKSKVLRALSLT
jgi:hypothetical protein